LGSSNFLKAYLDLNKTFFQISFFHWLVSLIIYRLNHSKL
jgi:hypothetical protein